MTADWPPKGRPFIQTRVGHQGDGRHTFMGYPVWGDELEALPLVARMLVAITGRLPSEHEIALAGCIPPTFSIADPRIPPLFLSRVVATHGSALSGIGAFVIACSRGKFGPSETADVARLLIEASDASSTWEDDNAVESWLRQRLAQQGRLPGFGHPLGVRDNGGATLARLVSNLGHDGRFWGLGLRLHRISTATLNLSSNVNLGFAAICLDIGIQPEATSTFITLMGLHTATANSLEASEQRDEVLRQLPLEYVEYRGREGRLSPRAKRAQDAGG